MLPKPKGMRVLSRNRREVLAASPALCQLATLRPSGAGPIL